MRKFLLLLCSFSFCSVYAQTPRVYHPTGVYPEGRLEIGALAIGSKYFGEFTDHQMGFAGGITTRYTFPFLPEFSLGARFTTGNLSYSRRYKSRFSASFERQFPADDFSQTPESRMTSYNAFDVLAYINLFPRHELNYYIMGGFSAFSFSPQDIEENPVSINGKRRNYPDFTLDRANFDIHPVVGLGVDYFIGKTYSIGVQSAFHMTKSDFVDGFASYDDESNRPTLEDAFAEIGVKLSYYFFTDPDIDHDALANSIEEEIGTDPYNPDTDADGLTDYDEVETYKSRPLAADSDEDGLSDGGEALSHHTNPNSPDSDSDGIVDFDEARLYRTNPLLADSDNDRLGDIAELKKGSNPLNGDSDSDGIGDYEDNCPNIFGVKERNGCPDPPYPPDQKLYTGKIQPALEKHDTVFIVREVANLKVRETYTFYGVNFEPGSDNIRTESEIILDDLVKWIKSNPEFMIEIQGHTDSDGSDLANQKLSEERANSVLQYLIKNGVPTHQLSAVGYGETVPVVSNDSTKGKARNRRIEFHIKEENPVASGQ